jgi:hypothetical protein
LQSLVLASQYNQLLPLKDSFTMFRFSIRDVLWLTVVVALGCDTYDVLLKHKLRDSGRLSADAHVGNQVTRTHLHCWHAGRIKHFVLLAK